MRDYPSGYRMARILLSLVIWVGIATLLSLSCSCQSKPDLRVIFLGNSAYSSYGGSQAPLEGYCSAAGFRCEALTNYDVFGKSREGRVDQLWSGLAQDQRLTDLFSQESFDYVVLWTRPTSVVDSNWVDTVEGLRAVVPRIASSGATTVLAASYIPPKVQYDFHGSITVDLVEDRFARLLREVGELRVNGVPPPVLYVPLARFWADGVARFGADAWWADSVHGSRLAHYATGCLWFTFLFDHDPRGVSFSRLPEHFGLDESKRDMVVSTEAVTWIQNRAWELYQTSRYCVQ
jgi:hypothetical protein